MAIMDGMTGIVVGAVFGGIFVLTCFISSVKAVRDRRRIKRKIAERSLAIAAAREFIEEKQNESTANGVTNNCPAGPAIICGPSISVPPFSVTDGIDNATFKHSHADIKSNSESDRRRNSHKLKTTAEIEFAKNSSVPKRTLSADVRVDQEDRFRHLSPDCLAVKKTMRRHSYEIAVAEHSWLPIEPPNFASSETIINTYRYCSNSGSVSRSSTVGFENRAYDAEDYRAKMTIKHL